MANKRKTKKAVVHQMLARSGGASMASICKATGWKPHSVRAAISKFRKEGVEIERIPSSFKNVDRTVYRLVPAEAGRS